MKLKIKNYRIGVLSVVLFCILIKSGFAQTARDTSTYSFSLQQAIDFAQTNQVQVQNAVYDEKIAQQKVRETVGLGLPQINGSVGVQDFLDLPVSLIPARAFNPMAPIDQYIAVKFGTQYNSTAGIEASQLVFSSEYLIGLQATKTYLELSRKATKRTKEEAVVAVTKAYYSALVNNERLTLFDANIERVKKLMEDTKILHTNGLVGKIDLDRITVTYNNLLVEKAKTERLVGLGVAVLKLQMGMDQKAHLILTDKLTDITFNADISADKFEYENRVEYSLMKIQRDISALQLKRFRMGYLPTVALFGSGSENAFRSKFDFFDSEQAWYPTIIVGAKISVSLFDGFQNAHRIQGSKLDILKANNNLRMMRQNIDMEQASAKINLQNAAASLQTQKENINLAESVYKDAKVKYDQGVGSNLEVITAETALKEAQTNYFNSLYEVLIAKVDYNKSIGNIK